MTRRVLNLLSVLSLLPCLISSLLWVRSYRYTDWFAWPWSATRHAQLYSAYGGLSYFDLSTRTPGEWVSGYSNRYIEPKDRNGSLAGNGFAGFRVYHGGKVRFWTAPYWFIGGVTALWPLARLARARRARRRRASHQCPSCGYDLRATPERCPECGMMAPT